MDEKTTQLAIGEHYGDPVERLAMDEIATMIYFVSGSVRIVRTDTIDTLVAEWKESRKTNVGS